MLKHWKNFIHHNYGKYEEIYVSIFKGVTMRAFFSNPAE